MSKKVEISELVVDWIDDNKKKLARHGHTLVEKEDFMQSVLKHGKLCDARTIELKWKQLVVKEILIKLKGPQYILEMSIVREKFPETIRKTDKLLYEGDKLNEEEDRIRESCKNGSGERVCETQPGVLRGA